MFKTEYKHCLRLLLHSCMANFTAALEKPKSKVVCAADEYIGSSDSLSEKFDRSNNLI